MRGVRRTERIGGVLQEREFIHPDPLSLKESDITEEEADKIFSRVSLEPPKPIPGTFEPTAQRLKRVHRVTPPVTTGEQIYKAIFQQGVLPKPFRRVVAPLDKSLEFVPGEIIRDEEGKLVKQYIKYEGITDFLIEAYDDWISNKLKNQIMSKHITLPPSDIEAETYICFSNVDYVRPKYKRGGEELPLLPRYARKNKLDYSLSIYTTVVHKRNDPKSEDPKDIIRASDKIHIGNVYLMLGSRNCYLYKKEPAELALIGEDPDDPFGYFIVHGSEKVVLLQELLRTNRVFLYNLGSKGSPVSRMTVNTEFGSSIMQISIKKKKTISYLVYNLSSLRKNTKNKHKGILVTQVYRYFLGPDYQREMEEMLCLFLTPGTEARVLSELIPTLVRMANIGSSDVDIIARKMSGDYTALAPREKEEMVHRLISKNLYPHMNNIPVDVVRKKLLLFSMQVSSMLQFLAGKRRLDDRDLWGNKRLESAGILMAKLFRGLFRKMLNNIQTDIKKNGGTYSSVLGKLKPDVINEGFRSSFTSAVWGVPGVWSKQNVSQTLKRDNWVSAIAHLTRIDVDIARNDKQATIRVVQQDQGNMICVVETPDGENVGILKNLALIARPTIDQPDDHVIFELVSATVGGQKLFSEIRLATYTCCLIVNGKLLGWCRPEATAKYARTQRQSLKFYETTGVVLVGEKGVEQLYISTDDSRLVRPLLIVGENGQLEIDNQKRRGQDTPVLLRTGCMEYLDAWEASHAKIASSKLLLDLKSERIKEAKQFYNEAVTDFNITESGGKVVRKDAFGFKEEIALDLKFARDRVDQARVALEAVTSGGAYTHCELDPESLLGIAASLSPTPERNAAPRNAIETSILKQAVGLVSVIPSDISGGNEKTKALIFPTRSYFEPQYSSLIGLNRHNQGQMLNLAIAIHSGSTEEDAFVINQTAINLGKLRIIKYLVFKSTISQAPLREELKKPFRIDNPERYAGITDNGLPIIGRYYKQTDIILGKVIINQKTGEEMNASSSLPIGDEGYVDAVYLFKDEGPGVMNVEIHLHMVRIALPGDKLAPRCAQKGTIAIIKPEIDLPFSELAGAKADMIINSHSLSRMTMALILEMFASKAARLVGERVNASAFRPYNLDEFRRILHHYGFNEFGYERMRSGETGELITSLIFQGPCYIQVLKHNVLDKYQIRGIGGYKTGTRQPFKGRKRGGGVHFGEMERDSVLHHGAAYFAKERLMEVSDAYTGIICKTCGTFAISYYEGKDSKCHFCGTIGNFGKLTTPFVFNNLVNYLGATGERLHLTLATVEEYKKNMEAQGARIAGTSPVTFEQLERNITAYKKNIDVKTKKKEEEEYNIGDIE